MQAFCCCSSRRRGKPIGHGDGEAAPSIPTSKPLVLTDKPPNWTARQTESLGRPLSRADEVPVSAQVSPCEGPVELCQLVVDSDSDNEDDASQSAKRSTGTLDVVRTKLIRHISQDNETRRQSRIVVGHSEEELARRAELRRFRQKRIQDELDKEGSNDGGSNRSHRSTRYLSPLIDLGQPGGGPRDTIEFTVDNGSTAPDLALVVQQDLCDPGQRRSSCPELAKHGRASVTSSARRDESSRSPDRSPKTPAIYPSRPSTAQDISPQRLTGCSHNAPRLNRVLGVDNDFDICHGSHAWDDQSALGIWLIAQGMRSRDSSLVRLGDPDSDKATDRERIRSPSQDFGGIDSVIDTPAPTQEDSMVAPSNSRDGWEDASANASRCRTQVADISIPVTVQGPEANVPHSEDQPEGHATGTNSKQLIDNASSNYPSVLPSFRTSPACSVANNYSLSPQDIENLELSPFQWHGSFSILRNIGHSEGQSSYATAEDNTPNAQEKNAAPSDLRRPSQVEFDNHSVAHSDTTSFQQREAELRTIEQRFGDILSRKQADAPVNSRFKEEFIAKSVTHAPTRTSLVTRLQCSLSRLSRVGSSKFVSIDNRHSASATVDLKPLPDNEHGGDVGDWPKTDEMGNSSIKTTWKTTGTKRRGDSRQTFLASQNTVQPSSAEASANEPRDRSRQHIPLWASDRRRGTSDGSVTTKVACGKSSICAHATPPESWARWPSHDRERRTKEANSDVLAATQGLSSTGSTSAVQKRQVAGEGDAIYVPQSIENEPHPLPKRLEKAVRTKLSRLLPSRGTLEHELPVSPQPDGRILQVRTSRDDFGGTRDEEVNKAKRGPTTTPGPDRPVAAHDRHGTLSADSLVSRPTARIGNRGETSQSTTELVPASNTCDASATPASERAQPDVFVTPLSRVQFDATAGSHPMDDCEFIKDKSRSVIRRWKSTGGHNNRKQTSSTWTERSTTQPLTDGDPPIVHDRQ